MPALATTTALVAGLATIELIKIASERVRFKKEQRQLEQRAKKTESSNIKGSAEGRSNINKSNRSSSRSKIKSSRGSSAVATKRKESQPRSVKQELNKWKNGLLDFFGLEKYKSKTDSFIKLATKSQVTQFAKKKLKQLPHHLIESTISRATDSSSAEAERNADATLNKHYWLQQQERLLSRFRNSFVNLARPMLAFSQPVPAERFALNKQVFSLWDTIEVKLRFSHLCIGYIVVFLEILFPISKLVLLFFRHRLT